MQVVAYQDAPDPPVDDVLRAACAEAMHVITAHGRTIVGADAVVHVYERLGYPVGVFRYAPFSWLIRPVYAWVAANRRRLAPWFFRRE